MPSSPERAVITWDIAREQAELEKLSDAGQAITGAAEAEHCEALLHSLLEQLAKLSAQGQKNAAGMIDHVDAVHDDVQQTVQDTRDAVIEGQVQQTRVVAGAVQEVRDQQSSAVDAAKQAADNAQRNLTTQILGFCTLLVTFLMREIAARRERHENAQKFAVIARAVGAPGHPPLETPNASESDT